MLRESADILFLLASASAPRYRVGGCFCYTVMLAVVRAAHPSGTAQGSTCYRLATSQLKPCFAVVEHPHTWVWLFVWLRLRASARAFEPRPLLLHMALDCVGSQLWGLWLSMHAPRLQKQCRLFSCGCQHRHTGLVLLWLPRAVAPACSVTLPYFGHGCRYLLFLLGCLGLLRLVHHRQLRSTHYAGRTVAVA